MSGIEQDKVNEIRTKNRSALKVLLVLYHPMFIGHIVHGRDLEEICSLGRSTVWRVLKYLWDDGLIEYSSEEKTYSARLTPKGAGYARYFSEQIAPEKYQKWQNDVAQAHVNGILPQAKEKELRDELRDYLSFL